MKRLRAAPGPRDRRVVVPQGGQGRSEPARGLPAGSKSLVSRVKPAQGPVPAWGLLQGQGEAQTTLTTRLPLLPTGGLRVADSFLPGDPAAT